MAGVLKSTRVEYYHKNSSKIVYVKKSDSLDDISHVTYDLFLQTETT